MIVTSAVLILASKSGVGVVRGLQEIITDQIMLSCWTSQAAHGVDYGSAEHSACSASGFIRRTY